MLGCAVIAGATVVLVAAVLGVPGLSVDLLVHVAALARRRAEEHPGKALCLYLGPAGQFQSLRAVGAHLVLCVGVGLQDPAELLYVMGVLVGEEREVHTRACAVLLGL